MIVKHATYETLPVVGVVNANNVCFDDEFTHSIDLGYILALQDHMNNGGTDDNFNDYFESNGPYLLGNWKKDDSGRYEPCDGPCGFSASFDPDANTICVERSLWTMVCRPTSPCYVMRDGRPCGDLDNPAPEGRATIAFSLPPDMFYCELENK